MKILINSASAKLGGGVTYITNVLRSLPGPESGHEFEVYLPPETARKQSGLPPNVRVVETNIGHAGLLKRLWWEQVTLRRRLREIRADVLFSTGGFAMFRCPVQQVLLVSNALYFSQLYRQELLPRHPWRLRLQFHLRSWLTRRSVESAALAMTPSHAARDELLEAVKVDSGKVVVNPYGVAEEDFPTLGFANDATSPIQNTSHHRVHGGSRRNLGSARLCELCGESLPSHTATNAVTSGPENLRLLYVSIYSDHKNLTTLLRALALLNRNGGPRFRLTTTVNPGREGTQWTCHRAADLALARDRAVAPWVEFVGPLGPEEARRLYRDADIFVFPSLVESFGHPMMEAMAAGLPIVAADTPINREVCGESAEYFRPLSPNHLAARLQHLAANPELQYRRGKIGCGRARNAAGWQEHVEKMLALSATTDN